MKLQVHANSKLDEMKKSITKLQSVRGYITAGVKELQSMSEVEVIMQVAGGLSPIQDRMCTLGLPYR